MPHFNGFMDRKNHVEFECVENVIVSSFNRLPAAKSRRILRHENRVVPVQRETGCGVARIERIFISFNDVDDVLIHFG